MIFYKNNILKNLIFSIFSLLFTTSTFAQLYVAPSGSLEADSSFIYVKDELLYVTGDIDLTENPDGATEASIYLRDEAQLIQGDNVANSGTGYISIHQNSPLYDAWDYALWSSPVGDQALATSGNQNFGALRFFNPQGSIDVDCDCYLGTDSVVNDPTDAFNGVQSPMQISRRWLYTYTNTTWTRFNDDTDVVPGLGFTMKGLGDANGDPDHDQTYDFRGRANNGNINAPILNAENSLSGNPYPSALDLNQVFYDNANIESIRYWDEDWTKDGHYYVDNKGGYGVWIPLGADPGGTSNLGEYVPATFWNYDNTGGQGTAVGAGGAYQRRFAPVGQGFVLYGTATGDVTYTNSQRVYVTESSGMSDFRTNDGDTTVPGRSDSDLDDISPIPQDNRLPLLRLNTYFNTTHIRQLVLAFSNESTDEIDRGFDAKSPMDSSTSDAYFPIGDENIPHVIQTVPFDINKQVPYTIELGIRSDVRISTEEEVNFEGPIYLYDNVEDAYQEINNVLQRSAHVTLPAGIYEDRFFITFVNPHKTQQVANEITRSQILEDVKFFQNNPAQQLEIANPEGYNIASANIFEMSGKLVYTESNLGDKNSLTFPTGNLSDGIYLVMLTTADNIDVNYKIIVSNK